MTGDDAGYEQFFVHCPSMLAVVGDDGCFAAVNQAWTAALGWEAEEIVGQPFLVFVHPDDVEVTQARFGGQERGETVKGFENRYRCQDGSYRWLGWEASPPRDGFVFAAAKDLTLRKELEAALRASEARTHSVLDTATSGIITIHGDGTVETFNRAAEAMFGYAADEVIGRNVKMLMPEPFHTEHDGYLRRYQETGRSAIIGVGRDVEGARKDGTRFPLHLSVSEFAVGSSRRFTGVVLHISERVAAQNAAQEALAEAKRASAAKSEFLSRMSHELRTPLNAVLGFAQLLELDASTDAQRESIEWILNAGRHLLELINEVLDISRIEAGALTLSWEPVELDEVLRECSALITPEADKRGIRLVAADKASEFVQADRQRLRQVVLNMLSNATKYNSEGGTITVAVTDPGAGHVRISVTDTGPGIAAEQRARLFQPFERLGAGKNGIEGTGLGLALSASLVGAMGGTIGADSTVGQGSTFWFELPRADAPEAPELAQGPGTRSHVTTPAPAAAATVLYIEDNPVNARFVKRALAPRLEIRLDIAPDGASGIERARRDQPRLILLDLHLPDLAGAEVLRRLRSDPLTSAIPIVVLSADAQPVRVREILAAGAYAYLTKPIDLHRLLGVVERVLGPAGS